MYMINSTRSVHNPYQQIRIRISSNQQINILKFGLGSEVHKSTSTWDPNPRVGKSTSNVVLYVDEFFLHLLVDPSINLKIYWFR